MRIKKFPMWKCIAISYKAKSSGSCLDFPACSTSCGRLEPRYRTNYKLDYENMDITFFSVPDPDPDPVGSEIIWLHGSGSGSVIGWFPGSKSGSEIIN